MSEAREQQDQVVKHVEKFNQVEMGIAQTRSTQESQKMDRLELDEQANAQAILDMKNKEFGMVRKVAKEMWIKTSFWMPENAEEELKNEVNSNAAAE